ncbi:MAG: hypothetical protein RLZZ165_1731 [Bacteroidota bacterium]
MPRAFSIWRDKNQMPGNKLFADELEQIVGKCAVLLTVVSEPYLASEWCKQELMTFLQNAEAQGGAKVDNDYRVFKINKLPVDRNALPSELNVTTGFDFYEIDPESRTPAPIDPSFGNAEKQRFIRKVYDVAVTLAKMLKSIDESNLKNAAASGKTAPAAASAVVSAPPVGGAPKTESADLPSGPAVATIYIPHPSKELREIRDELVGELLRRNCLVLPQEQGAFEDVDDFKKVAQADLEKCDFSIHMIGSRYGVVLDGTEKSMVELQNEWAVEESKKRGMKRLIWMPKDLGEVAGTQGAFIDRLRTDREYLIGADLIQDSIEILKVQVMELLKPKPVEVPKEDGIFTIYLLHQEADKDGVRELRKFFKDITLKNKPVKLMLPIFDGDAKTIREMQEQQLVECDAVMIYWDNGSQAWVESSLNEVRKSPAIGRTKPFDHPQLVYLTGKKSSAKEDWVLDAEDGLLDKDILTVQGFDKPLDAALSDYLKSLG